MGKHVGMHRSFTPPRSLHLEVAVEAIDHHVRVRADERSVPTLGTVINAQAVHLPDAAQLQ